MVFDKVVDLLKNYRDTEEEITPQTSFADLGLDSLDRVELAMSLETEFNVTLELNNASMGTVGEVAQAVEQELAKQQAGA